MIYKKRGLSYDDCIEFKRRQGLKPDCEEYKLDLLPENNIILYIVNTYIGILIDGMGGINVDGIKFVLDLEEVVDKPLITQKLITYLKSALKAQQGDS